MTAVAECVSEKEWFVAAPWGRLAVLAWGDCRSPPVLLCHGKLDTAATFRLLVRCLPQDYYYIGFDLPGNGKSDPFPPGLPLSLHDLMYAIKLLVDHFRWQKFIFIGHSLGTMLGMHYNLVYPGRIERTVYLDPIPAFVPWEHEDISKWYYKYYVKYFSEDAYHKHNTRRETAPHYTYEQAVELVKNIRELTAEAARNSVERILEPVGNGLYRFTFDQRMKIVTRPPYPLQYLECIYTAATIPILTILAEESIARGLYATSHLVFDESKYRRGNYKVVRVEGNHDVHLCHPERIARHVAPFLSGHSVDSKL